MMPSNTDQFPITVPSSCLSSKNISNSHSSTGILSRKNITNNYASTEPLSRKNSSNSQNSTGSLSRKNSSSSTSSKYGKSRSPPGQQSPTSTIPFPWKLHRILDDADLKGFNDVISWLPSENGFKVHKTKEFDEKIMPKYFDKTKYKSFQRQLNMWCFDRVGNGPYKGAYLHSCFVRGQPQLCEDMQRTKIKGIHSKKLRKRQDLLEGSNHSTNSRGDPLGRGSNHSTSSATSSSTVSELEIHNSIKRAAEKVADLEQQKAAIQRKLQMLTTQTKSVLLNSSTSSTSSQDAFQPLPLEDGDSLLFGGRHFFHAEEGKFSDRTQRRIGRQYSLELKGPGSDEHTIKEIDDKYVMECLNGSSNHSTNNSASDIMSPTPLAPTNGSSSFIIGLDEPTRRFSLLSTSIHNPYEKNYELPPRPPTNMNPQNINMTNMHMDMKTIWGTV